MKKIICLATFVFAVLISTPLFAYENEGNLQWSNKATNKMNWNDAINYCKNLNEGGHNDWRLPNIDELRTLIQNHSGTQSGGSCQISENAGKLSIKDKTSDCNGRSGSNFSKLGDTDWFWSSSTLSDITDIAWYINFGNGDVNISPKRGSYNVRCVMSKRTDNSKNNTNNPTATPSQSKTTAKKDVEPTTVGNLQWSGKAPKSMIQNDAVNYCKNLNEGGYTDWRLPNIDELRTLIQNHPGTQIGGSCKISEKAGKLAKSYWSQDCTGRDGCNFSKLGDFGYFPSSSVLPGNSDFAYSWFVNFSNGHVLNNDNWLIAWNHINVRCVRGEIAKADLLTTAQPKEPTKNQGITKIGNLQWSAKSSKMNWYYAVNYCKNLHQGGHNDWRLPNIDELRTLIQNHPGTQSGGSCPISENAGKLSFEDRTNDCNDRDASNFSKLCDSDWLWSSSTSSGYRSSAWYVHFFSGLVYTIDKTDDDGHVRCVR